MHRALVTVVLAGLTLSAFPGCAAATGPDQGMASDEAFDDEGVCPPEEPFGIGLGETIPDVELPDCDGNLHRIHDFCDREATWIFSFAPW